MIVSLYVDSSITYCYSRITCNFGCLYDNQKTQALVRVFDVSIAQISDSGKALYLHGIQMSLSPQNALIASLK